MIRHNVTFVITTSGLEVERSTDGTRDFVTKLVRLNPFLELQFVPPIPERMTRSKVLQVYCDEAGTYAPPGAAASWTIAKRCRTKK